MKQHSQQDTVVAGALAGLDLRGDGADLLGADLLGAASTVDRGRGAGVAALAMWRMEGPAPGKPNRKMSR